jgi:hypothetical protein
LESALDPARWRLGRPRAGAADALTFETDRPLDALGAALGLRLRRADGAAALASFEVAGLSVAARPRAPWPEAPLILDAAADLDDVCGNRPTEPFERRL